MGEPLEQAPYMKAPLPLLLIVRIVASSRRGWSLRRRVGLSIGGSCPLEETGSIESDGA